MLTGEYLPAAGNRHDIGLAIIYDLKNTGKTARGADIIMENWAKKVFAEDSDSAARILDVSRMVRDAYSGREYSFGCYGEVKKAYCSARCRLFNKLDAVKRPEPEDMSQTQLLATADAKTPEPQIADEVLASLGEVVRCNTDYFKWSDTHWERLDKDRFEYALRDACIKAYENTAKFNKMDSLFKQVKAKIPVAPEKNHFYEAAIDKFKYLDGTCHVSVNKKGKTELTMQPHNQKDLLAYCAPFPLFAPHNLPTTGDFEHYMQARKAVMSEDDFLATQEMFGAALIPYSPRVFVLYGKSNTGKSTSAVLIKRLLGDKNVSSVDPSSNYSFNWEPAIGCIANISTELNGSRPLQDEVIKKIRDKEAITINRKGVKAISGTLPFLHIYCCNSLPKSLEGNTGALDKRISLLEHQAAHVNGFGELKNLAHWLWNRDPGGVLDFARAGLAKLVENDFNYTVPHASRSLLEDWQESSDPVKLFVQDLIYGVEKADFLLKKVGEKDYVPGKQLYDKYADWAKTRGFGLMSIATFYGKLAGVLGLKPSRLEFGRAFSWPIHEQIKLEMPVV